MFPGNCLCVYSTLYVQMDCHILIKAYLKQSCIRIEGGKNYYCYIMKNTIIKHCNRTNYLDRLWNPSSLRILEMLDKHCYLYLGNQTMEETEEKSLPALHICELTFQRKKKKKEKQPQNTENQFEYWNVGVLENSSSISLISKFKFKHWALPLSLQAY